MVSLKFTNSNFTTRGWPYSSSVDSHGCTALVKGMQNGKAGLNILLGLPNLIGKCHSILQLTVCLTGQSGKMEIVEKDASVAHDEPTYGSAFSSFQFLTYSFLS